MAIHNNGNASTVDYKTPANDEDALLHECNSDSLLTSLLYLLYKSKLLLQSYEITAVNSVCTTPIN